MRKGSLAGKEMYFNFKHMRVPLLFFPKLSVFVLREEILNRGVQAIISAHFVLIICSFLMLRELPYRILHMILPVSKDQMYSGFWQCVIVTL